MAEELVGLRRTELPGVSDQEWQRAVEAVRDVLNAVPWERLAKDPADLVNAERLAKRVPAADQELSAGGRAAYELLLAGCCAGLAELARSVDRIMRDLQVGVSDGVTELLERDAQRADDFELRYADYVIRTTSSFELFGVARGRGPGRHSFDRSYVSLAVARRTGQDDDALTGAGVSAATAFEDARRVLLRGSAGAGKTTFLRWLALTAARDGLVPFFVPLRQFADGPLPTPERILDTTAPVLAEEKPDRWVVGRFRDGRALLLVDGIDELGSERRAEAAQWLEDLVAAYPDARYVVSTRPSAVDENWLGGARFTTYDLLPMSAEGVRDFLTAWHDAARAEQPDFTAWLDECEHSLAETLATRADLRKLASSPLLCGLLCALHQDGGMHLPRDRKSSATPPSTCCWSAGTNNAASTWTGTGSASRRRSNWLCCNGSRTRWCATAGSWSRSPRRTSGSAARCAACARTTPSLPKCCNGSWNAPGCCASPCTGTSSSCTARSATTCRLELMQNEVLKSLEPLAGHGSLRSLHLTQCPGVRDLSPLARTGVEELSLHFTPADLRTLKGARLHTLRVRHSALETGLAAIPADLPLRVPAVDNRPPGRSLLGVSRWPGLRVVECYGIPHPAELAELAELPALERLVIRQPESAVELTGLAGRVAVEVAA